MDQSTNQLFTQNQNGTDKADQQQQQFQQHYRRTLLVMFEK